MNREHRIRETLMQAFSPIFLVVNNTSAGHRGHQGASAESHFDIEIVSAEFVGMSPIARHRAVNAILQPFFEEGLHAVSLSLKPFIGQ